MAGRGNKHSKAKYEELVQNAINSSLRRDFSDSRLTMVSITRVELTEEYDHAKVWWDTFDASKRGDVKEALEGIRAKLRTVLAAKLNVRHVPEIQFKYDSQYEDEQKITQLLKENKDSGDD